MACCARATRPRPSAARAAQAAPTLAEHPGGGFHTAERRPPCGLQVSGDPYVDTRVRASPLPAAEIGFPDGSHERPVSFHRAALKAPPAEANRFERRHRHPDSREQMAATAAHNDIAAERIAAPTQDDRGDDIGEEDREDEPAPTATRTVGGGLGRNRRVERHLATRYRRLISQRLTADHPAAHRTPGHAQMLDPIERAGPIDATRLREGEQGARFDLLIRLVGTEGRARVAAVGPEGSRSR